MPSSKEKVALFDFCETLVNFQTADAFVDFVRNKKNIKQMNCIERIRKLLYNYHIIAIISKVFCIKYPLNKKIKLYQLKGFTYEELDEYAFEYYSSCIKPNLIQHILKRLIDLQNEGYSIVLVSGGYDIYLKYFAKEFRIANVISTKIKFNSQGICEGIYDGLDCLNNNKIELLEIVFDKKKIYSKAFSDSSSDIPFLMWANDGYVVSKGRHQNWQEKYNFKEIIW